MNDVMMQHATSSIPGMATAAARQSVRDAVVAPRPTVGAGVGSGSIFANALNAAKRGDTGDVEAAHEQLRDVAGQFVSLTFFYPLLQSTRDTAFKSDLIHGGQGEELFGTHFDMEIADRMTNKRMSIVDSIYRRFADRLPPLEGGADAEPPRGKAGLRSEGRVNRVG